MNSTARAMTENTKPIAGEVLARVRRLQWMFFDVDGVMTDGGLYYDANGESIKRFHVLDGHGLKALKTAGIRLGILSGRSHPATAARAHELGFDVLVQGVGEKGQALDTLARTHNIVLETCGFMGDDTPDIEVFQRVGFAASVPNAVRSVIEKAHWVSTRCGGEGAVRECCDFILQCRS